MVQTVQELKEGRQDRRGDGGNEGARRRGLPWQRGVFGELKKPQGLQQRIPAPVLQEACVRGRGYGVGGMGGKKNEGMT